MEQFAAAIYAFCSINAKTIVYEPSENKRICWEEILNCAITKDNLDGNKLFKVCKDKYLSSKIGGTK